jgi:hypothetical protein
MLVIIIIINWSRHEGVLGSGDISPRILDLGTRWRWVVSFTPRPLYSQGKSPWYTLDRRLGGPQSRSGHGGVKKHSQSLPGLKSPIIHTVAHRYTAELYQLLQRRLETTKKKKTKSEEEKGQWRKSERIFKEIQISLHDAHATVQITVFKFPFISVLRLMDTIKLMWWNVHIFSFSTINFLSKEIILTRK